MQDIGDGLKRIPHIYEAVENRQIDHQVSIVEMDGKLYDQLISVLIDLGSNYRYGSLELVDKYGLSKEVHVEAWLVQLDTSTMKILHH